MINANEVRISASLSISGNSVWRVTKPSMNPAMMNTGMVPITIFTPRFAPLLKDSSLE